jgi:hypothetical protein
MPALQLFEPPIRETGMIPREFTARFIPREDGGLRVCSDDLPGLILSSKDSAGIMRELLEIAEVLMRHNDPKPVE